MNFKLLVCSLSLLLSTASFAKGSPATGGGDSLTKFDLHLGDSCSIIPSYRTDGSVNISISSLKGNRSFELSSEARNMMARVISGGQLLNQYVVLEQNHNSLATRWLSRSGEGFRIRGLDSVAVGPTTGNSNTYVQWSIVFTLNSSNIATYQHAEIWEDGLAMDHAIAACVVHQK